MRTTLTLEDDLAGKLKALAHRRQISFKEVVNTVIRRGLAAQERLEREREPYRIQTFRSAFRPGVDPMKLNQLADDLEVRRFEGTER